mmetsp:Transcript_11822/g.28361  ORF Transcript_11822/g.28361 Transcript_11822/m.28361 type:complete len:303 (+) Transcript_11822:398-1306(+)
MTPNMVDEEKALLPLHHVNHASSSTTPTAASGGHHQQHQPSALSPGTASSMNSPAPAIASMPSMDDGVGGGGGASQKRKSQQQQQQHHASNHIRASITSPPPAANVTNKKPPPKLLHPILHKVPMHIRFGLNGFLSNVLFMIAYNAAVVQFEHVASSSTIYATVYLIFIPITHAIISLLVFGWPERYLRSLMSNAPVGLTAIVLGASLTAYLDQIEFNEWVAAAMKQYVKYFQRWMPTFLQMPVETTAPTAPELDEPEKDAGPGGSGEFYSSIFVLLVTGIWTFALSVFVNNPAEPLEKKEL